MSKHTGKKDRAEKARRRLVKAQLDLHAAQEKRAHAITRAEHEVELAKQRGNKWVTNATERVERRAGAMAQAEAHLLAITTPKHPKSLPSETVSPETAQLDEGLKLTVSSPESAADVLERRESEVAAQREARPLTIPDSIPIDSPNASNGFEAPGESEHRT